MRAASVLVIGGGIGGLTAAIALRQRGFAVVVIEQDPDWAVYGVGILQQANVVRAMAQLGLLQDYLGAGFGFDAIELYAPTGQRLARFDLVIGADGLYSRTRQQIFPDAPTPAFTGQSVWRHNFPRSPDVVNLHNYVGPRGIGLAPLSADLMYLFLTTPEPGNPRFERAGLAAAMRERLANPPPALAPLVAQIVDDSQVVYKPLEWIFLTGPWHRGRVVLLGDAVHATTPHLGQGAGMAIEDSVVLAEELLRAGTPQQAFTAYRTRRFERCRYLVEASLSVCHSQLGIGPPIDHAQVAREMLLRTAEPL